MTKSIEICKTCGGKIEGVVRFDAEGGYSAYKICAGCRDKWDCRVVMADDGESFRVFDPRMEATG